MKSFGSAHPSGIIGVLADGSVRNISCTINPVTWTDLDDGNTLGDF
jgi:hypothetical protein